MNVNEESSKYSNVRHGVPQGSVLVPFPFTLYMLLLGNILRKHSINFHCYEEDTQLYLSMKSNETNQLAKLQACLKVIKLLYLAKTTLERNYPMVFSIQLDNAFLRFLDGIALASSISLEAVL